MDRASGRFRRCWSDLLGSGCIASLTGVTLLLGCTVAPTPPSSTPVYEDETLKGAQPLDVERVSVNEPSPSAVTPQYKTTSPPQGTVVGAGGAAAP